MIPFSWFVATLTLPAAAPPSCHPAEQPAAPVVGDTTRRPQMPIDSILAALVDRRRTSGELIVGVKEPGASRGVSTRGVQLPLVARDAAVDVIRQNFPDLAITTIGRTFVVVRPPVSRELLVRLHELCVVDYLAPNWSNGVVGATP